MQFFLCDRCEKVITPEALEKGLVRVENGQYWCAQCQAQDVPQEAANRELALCDRCAKSIPIQLLRTGRALLVAGRTEAPGKIYCERCRGHFLRQSQEWRDLRFLIVLFALFIIGPLLLGLGFSWIRRQTTEAPLSPPRSAEALPSPALEMLQKEIAELRSIILQRESFPATPAANPVVSASPVEPNPLAQLVEQVQARRIASLEQSLGQAQASQRLVALLQWGQWGGRQVTTPLVKALEDTDPLVRSLAAQVVANAGGREHVHTLFRRLSDPHPLVRRSIAKALEFLTQQQFIFFQDITPQQWKLLNETRQALESK